METDTKIEKTKMVKEFDGSSSNLASDERLKERESQDFDVNRVMDSVDDGGDVDINTPLKELSARKNICDRKMGFREDSVDVSEVKEVLKESEVGQRIYRNGRGDLMGSDVNGENSKVVGDCGAESETMKTKGKRGRRSKLEFVGKSHSDVKIDPNKKVSDVLGSISQRTRNRVIKGKIEVVKDINVEIAAVSDDGDVQGTGFCVGDFVWGKIKSHPWWPGRIYDSSCASDFALRYKHEGRVLVAYFGDRTFAWCDPSQLKRFEENFEEMSKQSSLKNFVNAVEEAVDEFCCLVELHTNGVIAEQGSHYAIPLAVNAGIKEGVHVSLCGVEKFSEFYFNPTKMLSEIQNFARNISASNVLELRVLKRNLYAFYQAKGRYLLPVLDEDNVLQEGLARGPDELNCASPRELSVAQTGPETPEGNPQRRRKEKSMAELLGSDTKVDLLANEVDGSKKEMKSRKLALKSGRKKRKFVDDGQELSDVKARIFKDKLESKSGQKRRRITDENQSPVVQNSRTTRSSARATAAEKTSSNAKEDGCTELDLKKKKKKKKRMAKDRKLSVSLEFDNVGCEEVHGRMSPREKKRSKYLSPPYTSTLSNQKTLGSAGGSLELSDVSSMGKSMIVKCSAVTSQKSSKKSGCVPAKSDNNKTYRVDVDSKICRSVKSIRSSDEVLSEMKCAALDPKSPRKNKSFDSVKGFLSSYRSTNYKDGTDYNPNKKDMGDSQKRERNSSKAMKGSDKKLPNKVDRSSFESKTSGRSGTKKKEQKSDLKMQKNELGNGSNSPAALLITFPKEYTLPGKDELMKMHSKFGHLDDSKTEVIPKSFSAKIVFLNSSDAEAAMEGMQKSSPFGDAKVSYKIQTITDPTSKAKKINAQKKKIKEGKSPENLNPIELENEPLAVIFIKQKLEAMNSMLAQTDGKMTEETKSNLENEVKELLKKVKMMTSSSPS